MRTRTLAAAFAAVALAFTAGCGSVTDAASGGDDTSSSSSSSSKGDTSEGGSSDEGATVLTTDNFADELSGAQVEAQTAHMTLSADVMGQSMEAQADVKTDADPANSAMSMTMDVAGQSIEMVMADGAIYMKAPGTPQDKWMKISLDDVSAAGGEALAEMRNSMDPAQAIKNLKDALKTVKDTGETETLDGVEAKRYDVTLDTAKIADMAGQDAASIPDEITYQYWVGPDNLPRKVVVDLAGMPMEMTFTKWGEDVDIAAPPADEVVDGSQMLDQLQR